MPVQEYPSHLVDRVASVIRAHKLMHKDDKVIVAVSGGSDSLALLYLLHDIDLPLNLVAAYVDHGLRPHETPLEQRKIEECCQSLQIPLAVRSVNVHKLVADEKRSPEDAARVLRYGALEQVRHEHGAKVIAVGHNADDQVEEFFLRLIRGSSCKGLSGMTVRRDNIVRPLLFEKKGTLSAFLSEHDVSCCYDSSNSNRQFLRNRVRLELLPTLENEFNPAIRRIILHNMDILSEENKFLEKITEEAYTKYVNITDLPTRKISGLKLTIKGVEIFETHLAIRRRIIEKCLWHMGIRPTYDQIDTLLKFIETAKNGSELHLGDGVRAEKRLHDLIVGRPLRAGKIRGSRETAPSINQSIHGPGIHHIAKTGKKLILKEMAAESCNNEDDRQLRVDLKKISFPLLLRSCTPGERFHPCGGPGRKKISRYFNDQKIPAKERPAWPVLLCDEKVVALPGLQVDHDYRVTANTTDILALSWRDSEE